MTPWEKAGSAAEAIVALEGTLPIQRYLAPLFLRLRDLQRALEPFAASSLEHITAAHLKHAAVAWPTEGTDIPEWLKTAQPRAQTGVQWEGTPSAGGLHLWYAGPQLASVVMASPGGETIQWPTGEHETVTALRERIPVPHFFARFPTP